MGRLGLLGCVGALVLILLIGGGWFIGARNHMVDPNAMAQFAGAQENLSGALSRLLVVVERYPDLKSNQNFLELQSQLEGTENRIAVERKRYNDVAATYNTAIKKFPANLVAGSKFPEKAYFRGTAGSEKAPEVNFNPFGNTPAPAPAPA